MLMKKILSNNFREILKIDLKETELELEDLRKFIRSHEELTDQKFFDFQKKMLNTSSLLKDLSNFSQEVCCSFSMRG